MVDTQKDAPYRSVQVEALVSTPLWPRKSHHGFH